MPFYYADRFTVPQFAHQGFFSDITAQAEAAGVTSDQYFDFAWNEATYKGSIYTRSAVGHRYPRVVVQQGVLRGSRPGSGSAANNHG